MADPHLIVPVPRTTASKITSSGGRRRELPSDLLRDASRRLGVMCLVAAGLWTLGTGLWHLAVRSMNPGDPRWLRLSGTDVIAASGVIASVLLFFYTRKPDRDPRRILDLGARLYGGHRDRPRVHLPLGTDGREPAPRAQISWIGAVVLMFAAIVPSTPLKTAIAGLIAVSMNPVGMLIARAQGTWKFDAPAGVVLMHYPTTCSSASRSSSRTS